MSLICWKAVKHFRKKDPSKYEIFVNNAIVGTSDEGKLLVLIKDEEIKMSCNRIMWKDSAMRLILLFAFHSTCIKINDSVWWKSIY